MGCVIMRNVKSMLLGVILTISILSLVGCQGTKDRFYGDWAYIHDTETTIISFKTNNKAEFNGNKYSYTYDDSYVTLTSGNDEIKFRYKMDGADKWLFYQTKNYEFSGDGTPNGLTGLWEDKEDKWSFEFTADGTFREDTYFPGYYTETEDGAVKLVYNDHFEDTIIYYEINGNELTVDYPWTMVRTGTILSSSN